MMLADTADRALAVVASLDGRIRQHHMALPGQPTAGASARAMIGDICLDFGVTPLVQPARLIMSELVTNAVEHAGTDFVVTISRGGNRLHVAVHDCAPRFTLPSRPALTDPAALSDRGRGLMLVHKLATVWGSMPTRGGKVVWATVT